MFLFSSNFLVYGFLKKDEASKLQQSLKKKMSSFK